MKKFLLVSFIILLTLAATQKPANSSPLVSPPAQILKISHGVHLRPTLEYGQEVALFNNMVGKQLAVLMYFLSWQDSDYSTGSYFNSYLEDRIQAVFGSYGPTIMLTWQPLYGRKPGCTQNYSGVVPPADIIAGKCDTYIRNLAITLKNRPERFLLRFAHEMNIQVTPWWPGNFGVQDASLYVQMYRHVHDVFTAQNVPNVEWVWSPNYESNPPPTVSLWNDRKNYYPGDSYVDWIGLSGFNWGGTKWETFSTIYDSATYRYVLDEFACNYAKPQILAEFGSVEGTGGNTKANWITDAYLNIAQQPFVRAAVWFNDYAFGNPSAADFRVTTGTAASGGVYPLPASTGAWTNAYKQAIANTNYVTYLPTLSQATPPTTYCGSGEPVYKATPVSATVSQGSSSVHEITAMLYSQNITLSLKVPPGSNLTGSFNPTGLPAPWGKTVLTVQTSASTPLGIYNVVVQGNGVDLLTIPITVQAPGIAIAHDGTGQPGSTFTIIGQLLPPNKQLILIINGHELITVQTDSNGSFQFVLGTSVADTGYYTIEVLDFATRTPILVPGGTSKATLVLLPNAQTWNDGTPIVQVQPDISTYRAFLPLLVRP